MTLLDDLKNFAGRVTGRASGPVTVTIENTNSKPVTLASYTADGQEHQSVSATKAAAVQIEIPAGGVLSLEPIAEAGDQMAV